MLLFQVKHTRHIFSLLVLHPAEARHDTVLPSILVFHCALTRKLAVLVAVNGEQRALDYFQLLKSLRI